MCGQYFKFAIIIGSWSMVQTLIHMSFTILGYHLYNCQIQPHSLESILLYLTYFYDQKCGPISLTSNAITNFVNLLEQTSSDNDSISYEIVLKDILDRAELPLQTNPSTRIVNYMYASLVLDTLWAVASITLISGAVLKLMKSKSVLVYGPWLFTTAIIVFFDVVSSVHFGLDLLNIKNFSTWLKFIGVKNYKTFTIYDDLPYSSLITIYPTTLLCLLFARFFIVWVSNILCFYCIIHVVTMLYHGRTCETHNHDYYNRHSGSNHNGGFGGMDPTASARIRTWQMFYGTVNSVTSSTSSNEDMTENNTIHSVSSKANESMTTPNQVYRRTYDPNQQTNDFYELRSEKSSIESVIRNQLPWSYFTKDVELEYKTKKLSVDTDTDLIPQKYVDEQGNIQVKPSEETYTKL